MRISNTENSTPQALLPAEKIKSWALEVEMEDNQERVRQAAKSKSNSNSPNWLDRGSKQAGHTPRSEEDTWRQSKIFSKHSTSPNRSDRSRHCRDRATSLHPNAHHMDAEMLKTTSKSRHMLSDKHQPKETGKKAIEYRSGSKRDNLHYTSRSDQSRSRRASHVFHKTSQDLNCADRSDVSRGKYASQTLHHSGPPRHPPAYAKQESSRSCTMDINTCNYGGLRNQADEERCPTSGCFNAKSKLRFDRHAYGKAKDQDLPVSANSDDKEYWKLGIVSCNTKNNLQEGFGLCESARIMDAGALQRVVIAKRSDTTSLQEEGEISTSAELSIKNVQCTLSNCEGMMVVSQDMDDKAKGDGASVDSKREYEMLASLLLDDSLDIDQDFDVALTASGSVLPDSMGCGSIFGDDLELPSVNMDFASVEVKFAVSAEENIDMPAVKTVELKGPYLPALCGLLEGGKNMTIPKIVSGNNSVALNHPRKEDSTGRIAEKLKGVSNLVGARSFSRVFVDVTNTFEVPDAGAARGDPEEDDVHRLSQRLRQVEFGKNTLGYERYCELVPRCNRKPRDPQTPNPKRVCSKRSWDGQIRKWRRLLHHYDPPREDGEEEAEDYSSHLSSLQKEIDLKRTNISQGFSEPNKKDVNLMIYEDLNEF